jgi:hypothetical protein
MPKTIAPVREAPRRTLHRVMAHEYIQALQTLAREHPELHNPWGGEGYFNASHVQAQLDRQLEAKAIARGEMPPEKMKRPTVTMRLWHMGKNSQIWCAAYPDAGAVRGTDGRCYRATMPNERATENEMKNTYILSELRVKEYYETTPAPEHQHTTYKRPARHEGQTRVVLWVNHDTWEDVGRNARLAGISIRQYCNTALQQQNAVTRASLQRRAGDKRALLSHIGTAQAERQRTRA